MGPRGDSMGDSRAHVHVHAIVHDHDAASNRRGAFTLPRYRRQCRVAAIVLPVPVRFQRRARGRTDI